MKLFYPVLLLMVGEETSRPTALCSEAVYRHHKFRTTSSVGVAEIR